MIVRLRFPLGAKPTSMLLLFAGLTLSHLRSPPPRYIIHRNDKDPLEEMILPHSFCDQSQYGANAAKLYNISINSENGTDSKTIDALASKGFPPAIHSLAEFYEFGLFGRERNFSTAFHLFKQAAEKGYAESFSSLSFFYKFGLGTQANMTLSEIYSSISEESARSLLSFSFSSSYGTTKPKSSTKSLDNLIILTTSICKVFELNKDHERSLQRIPFIEPINDQNTKDFEFIADQAKRNNPDAQIDLGVIYYNGELGKEVDFKKAKAIFEQHPDDPRAQGILGRMYHFGQGTEVDLKKAEKLYETAAKQKDTNAMAGLGLLHIDKDGINLIKEAAEAGDEAAEFNLAGFYATGRANIKQNLSEAYRRYKILHKKGFSFATLNVASMLLSGSHKFNEERGMRYLWEVIDKGPWDRLGEEAETSYFEGDFSTALQLWMELADMGIETAAFNSGLLLLNWKRYWKAPPLELNEQSAVRIGIQMMKTSYRRGNFNSGKYISEQYLADGKAEKAIKWLKRTEIDPSSDLRLAELHLKGKVLPRKYNVIEQYLQKAIKNGGLRFPVMIYYIWLWTECIADLIRGIAGAAGETRIQEVLHFIGESYQEHSLAIKVFALGLCTILMSRKAVEVWIDMADK